MCFGFLCNLSLKHFLYIRKVERESIKNICQSSCQRAVFIVRFMRKLNFPDIFEKYSSTKFHEIPSVCTDGQTDMTKLTVAFRNWTHLIKSHFLSTFSQTQNVSTTQVGNLIALNQADSKQRNKIFANCFESRIMETELNREKNYVEGNGNHVLQLHRYLVHYYYYYICFHLYARYLQLYT